MQKALKAFALLFFCDKCFEFCCIFGVRYLSCFDSQFLIESIQFDWIVFAALCVLQAINGLVGWYEESNSSDAIKALRKNFAGVQCEAQWPWIVA